MAVQIIADLYGCKILEDMAAITEAAHKAIDYVVQKL